MLEVCFDANRTESMSGGGERRHFMVIEIDSSRQIDLRLENFPLDDVFVRPTFEINLAGPRLVAQTT
jgi:hypothetical protein